MHFKARAAIDAVIHLEAQQEGWYESRMMHERSQQRTRAAIDAVIHSSFGPAESCGA